MAYLEQLQGGLRELTRAAEDGRRDLDQVIAPVNGAISEIRGAATELEGLPGVSSAMAAKVQRAMRGVENAQAKVNRVVNTYSSAARVLKGIDERMQGLGEQVVRARNAVDKVMGKVGGVLGDILPTSVLSPSTAAQTEVASDKGHLLAMYPLSDPAHGYFFTLDTAAYHQLVRTSEFAWKGQERLGRRSAQQSVGIGAETLRLDGLVMPMFRRGPTQKSVGLKQLQDLRDLGERREPFTLVSSEGGPQGTWCLTKLTETQNALLSNGVPRQQTFSLEFIRYGDDL